MQDRARTGGQIPSSVLRRAVVFFIKAGGAYPGRHCCGSRASASGPEARSDAHAGPDAGKRRTVSSSSAGLHTAGREDFAEPSGIPGPFLQRRARRISAERIGLNVAIHKNASICLPWAKFQHCADAYSAKIGNTEGIVASIVPGLSGCPTRELMLLQAVCGVVWEQNGRTFTLTSDGPRRCTSRMPRRRTSAGAPAIPGWRAYRGAGLQRSREYSEPVRRPHNPGHGPAPQKHDGCCRCGSG